MDIKSLEKFLNYVPYIDNPQYIVDGLIKKAKEYLPENQIEWIQKGFVDFA